MDSEDEELFLLTAAAACIIIKKKQKKRIWTKNWLLKREKLGHTNLLRELSLEPTDWRNYLRMDESTYFKLLELVTPLIIKQDTNMRQAITPHERLCATLRFLASGMSYEELKFPTVISPQCLGTIIPETCKAIITALADYIKIPQNEEDWKIIAKDFESRWQFPNCLGAVDGKHIRIIPPVGSGSLFYNYEKFHSIVLMACANANYEFIWLEVGTNGRISDGGVIRNTTFYEKLLKNELHLPVAEKCNNSLEDLPYVFIGDEAFALRSDCIKPFNKAVLTYERKIFNYRISRARRIIENVFGILASRFKIFHTSINLKLDNINLVVITCCVLHNFLRRTCALYSSDTLFDLANDTDNLTIPSPCFAQLQSTVNRNPNLSAKQVREMYVKYFNEEGRVTWQDDQVD